LSDWVREAVMKNWDFTPSHPLSEKLVWWGYSDMYGSEKNRVGHPVYRWKWFIVVQNRGEDSVSDRGWFIYDTLHSPKPYYSSYFNRSDIEYYFPNYSLKQRRYLTQAIHHILLKIVRDHFIEKHGSYENGVDFVTQQMEKKDLYIARYDKGDSQRRFALYKNGNTLGGGFKTLNMAKRFCEELYNVQMMLDVCQSMVNYDDFLFVNELDFANQVVEHIDVLKELE